MLHGQELEQEKDLFHTSCFKNSIDSFSFQYLKGEIMYRLEREQQDRD